MVTPPYCLLWQRPALSDWLLLAHLRGFLGAPDVQEDGVVGLPCVQLHIVPPEPEERLHAHVETTRGPLQGEGMRERRALLARPQTAGSLKYIILKTMQTRVHM